MELHLACNYENKITINDDFIRFNFVDSISRIERTTVDDGIRICYFGTYRKKIEVCETNVTNQYSILKEVAIKERYSKQVLDTLIGIITTETETKSIDTNRKICIHITPKLRDHINTIVNDMIKQQIVWISGYFITPRVQMGQDQVRLTINGIHKITEDIKINHPKRTMLVDASSMDTGETRLALKVVDRREKQFFGYVNMENGTRIEFDRDRNIPVKITSSLFPFELVPETQYEDLDLKVFWNDKSRFKFVFIDIGDRRTVFNKVFDRLMMLSSDDMNILLNYVDDSTSIVYKDLDIR